jgi:hypothetical protein
LHENVPLVVPDICVPAAFTVMFHVSVEVHVRVVPFDTGDEPVHLVSIRTDVPVIVPEPVTVMAIPPDE